MNRRAILATILWSPWALASKLDALLVGDSHGYQLGPRFRNAAQARAHRVDVEARGGSSTRQWRERRWFRDALVRHPTAVVLVSLGTNCTKAERGRLSDDIAALVLEALDRGVKPIWLFPPSRLFPLEYLRDALDDVGVDWLMPPPLQLERDQVHATDRALRVWAAQIVREVWSG